MAKPKEQDEITDEGPSTSNGRNLRKRKVNLNRLASKISCPMVCQFQHCGVQLADGDTLAWHYEGHYANEIERLDHIRVKRNPNDFPDRESRRQVRDAAFERISRRRTRRQMRPSPIEPPDETEDLACPVCNLPVPSDDYTTHIDNCLVNTDVNPEDEDDEDVDVDLIEGYETYTWAGHTRVRATSLVQGGLRGPGFVSLTRGDEDQELDIEGDDEESHRVFGPHQYTESDLILPAPETEAEVEDFESRSSIQQVLTGQKPVIVREEKDDEEISDKSEKETIRDLQEENDELRKKSMCNICMDSYRTPLVSVVCWHVSCEECWMRALGTKKLCPQCKVIIQPKDLRKIFM